MKNKSFKRFLAAALIAANVMTAGVVAMPVTSQAAVFKNNQEMAELLVFGQNYSGIFAKDIDGHSYYSDWTINNGVKIR